MTADQLLWDRYRELLGQWRAEQRDRAVFRYRAEHQEKNADADPPAAESALDAYRTTPTDLVPPPAATPTPALHPVHLPPQPHPPTISNALAWGAGGGIVVALVWTVMMAAGWSDGASYLIPILIAIGVFLAAIGGTATAIGRYLVRNSKYRQEQRNYGQISAQASASIAHNDRVQLDARLAAADDAADLLLWEQLQQAPHAEGTESVQTDAPAQAEKAQPLTDDQVLEQFDAESVAIEQEVLDQAREDGTAPDSVRGWLNTTAATVKKVSQALHEFTDLGWEVKPVLSENDRDITVVEGPSVEPTTVVFHHATPDQLKSAEALIASYDEQTLAYRPIPGTVHDVPDGCPKRAVHLYTTWPVIGLDGTADGYGIIGSTAFLTDWGHLTQTVKSAEL